jgi:hypothetical protein
MAVCVAEAFILAADEYPIIYSGRFRQRRFGDPSHIPAATSGNAARAECDKVLL